MRLLDHFFEQELLPRFNQARNLREASVARKIGVLRESVTSALETLLQRGKRDSLNPIDTQEIEARLRHISGEIGEQRTHLDQEFLELGERPEVILAELAKMAAARICYGENSRIDSSELLEWTNDVIQGQVDRALSRTRGAMNEAIEGLRGIAAEIARSDMPTQEEAHMLLRNAPRFELSFVPGPVGAPYWRWTGRKFASALARQSVHRAFEGSFKEELHRYGRALSQWGEHTARRMLTLVNSYGDAYRAQLNRMRGLSAEGMASPELEKDLSLLLKWNTRINNETMQARS